MVSHQIKKTSQNDIPNVLPKWAKTRPGASWAAFRRGSRADSKANSFLGLSRDPPTWLPIGKYHIELKVGKIRLFVFLLWMFSSCCFLLDTRRPGLPENIKVSFQGPPPKKNAVNIIYIFRLWLEQCSNKNVPTNCAFYLLAPLFGSRSPSWPPGRHPADKTAKNNHENFKNRVCVYICICIFSATYDHANADPKKYYQSCCIQFLYVPIMVSVCICGTCYDIVCDAARLAINRQTLARRYPAEGCSIIYIHILTLYLLS